ncbi:MAG: restriction endonuclease subunit S [Rubrivivax sp.]|nr:restriction endonuclease subunit S [Rubrivivax sp.]
MKLEISNAAGWPTARLDELCALVSRGSAPVYVEESPVLAIGQRCVTASGFDGGKARPHSRAAMRGALTPVEGDVLLNSTGTGTIGRSCVFRESGRFIVDGHVTLLRPQVARLDGRWLSALLGSPAGQRHLERFCFSGSTNQVELNGRQLRSTEIPVPAIREQHTVGDLLDALDTTIHQTEAIIEKLKRVKQGLLHDLLTRGIDDNGELRPPQYEAPHLYKRAPLGWTPVAWDAGRVSAWLEGRPKNGYSPQPAGRWTGIQMLGLGCLTASGFEPRQLKDAPATDQLVGKALLTPGDLLMSRANTRELVGMVGRYHDVGTPCCYPDLMMRLTPTSGTTAAFLELLLRSPDVRRQVQASASGTSGSMVKISSSTVLNLHIAMPSLAEQRRILQCLEASDSSYDFETGVLHKLRELKLGLMDDLLTGRVRVTPLLASLDV